MSCTITRGTTDAAFQFSEANLTGLYQEWGFRSSPFETRPLPPTAEGASLLVGREDEVNLIHRRILDRNKIVTVEGDNGIGKTSINNVAAYSAYKNFIDAASDTLLIPCNKSFQLHNDSNPDEFVRNVLMHVAITLCDRQDELASSGRATAELNRLTKWLMNPDFRAASMSLGLFGHCIGGGRTLEPNTGAGFETAGLSHLIRRALEDAFPEGEGGGVVCTIDNLELLRESAKARDMMGVLRDELLIIPGLRWILCGSTGIVRSLMATPRLDGYLHSPVEVAEVDANLSSHILSSRIDAYKVNEEAYLPLEPVHFSTLFLALNSNIRDALSQADNYCNWVADAGELYSSGEEKTAQFHKWLKSECISRLEAALPALSPRPLKLFDAIVAQGGQCAPGDHTSFDFNTASAMRTQILRLEAANLVRSARDEDDQRRKSIVVTPNGWFVNYARNNFSDPLFERLTASDSRDTDAQGEAGELAG